MPFVRFSRDRRGYEHTYLIHAASRKGAATKILYWFRSPPGIKVGRVPFDDTARRTLEAQYPGVTFDWQKFAESPVPPVEVEHWRERRRSERAAKQARMAAARDDQPELAAADGSGEGAEFLDAPTAEDAISGEDAGLADTLVEAAAGIAAAVDSDPLVADSPEDADEPEPSGETAETAGVASPDGAPAAGGPGRRRRRRGGRRRRRGSGTPDPTPNPAE